MTMKNKDARFIVALVVVTVIYVLVNLFVMAAMTSATEQECRHYSLKGNSGIGKDEVPVFPADYWQANTSQEPHMNGNDGKNVTWVSTVGLGLHYTSHKSEGNRDWFYFDCKEVTPSPTPTTPTPTPTETSATPTPTQSTPTSTPTPTEPYPTPTDTPTESTPVPTPTSESPAPTQSSSSPAATEASEDFEEPQKSPSPTTVPKSQVEDELADTGLNSNGLLAVMLAVLAIVVGTIMNRSSR